MPVTRTAFGRTNSGIEVDLYTLTSANGLVARIATLGATITGLEVPDRNGKLDDVVLGYEGVEGYLNGQSYFGATVGRVANRIRDAKFQLAGQAYDLAANDGAHHLHGGSRGWDKVVWVAAPPVDSPDGPALTLTHLSPSGDEGYPGTVRATTVYTLGNKNELRVSMQATTDQPTIVNMVHHTYWNLAGASSGFTILDHQLRLSAARYTPGDPVVPTGVELPVAGTPFDFTIPKAIGRDLGSTGGNPIGYDHNFVVDGEPGRVRAVARLQDPKSGRVMTLEADQPGVQFYSGNFLDGKIRGKAGVAYARNAGLCLETQKFPNAVNIPGWRDQVVLKPGQTYKHTMIHRFSAE